MAEDIEFTLSVDTSRFDRSMRKLIEHPMWTELAARLEEKRQEQNRRAVAWWQAQRRPVLAYRDLVAGRRNGKSWAGRSCVGGTAAGAPDQGDHTPAPTLFDHAGGGR